MLYLSCCVVLFEKPNMWFEEILNSIKCKFWWLLQTFVHYISRQRCILTSVKQCIWSVIWGPFDSEIRINVFWLNWDPVSCRPSYMDGPYTTYSPYCFIDLTPGNGRVPSELYLPCPSPPPPLVKVLKLIMLLSLFLTLTSVERNINFLSVDLLS